MRTDNDICAASCDCIKLLVALRLSLSADNERCFNFILRKFFKERFQHFINATRVLIGKNFRRRHECRLIPAVNCDKYCNECNDSLTASDIALQQAVHRFAVLHIGAYLMQYFFLCTR